MPGSRRHNPRAVKLNRSYTVDEAARALRVSEATIRRWISKDGLPVIDDKRPFLILGGDLIDFLKARTRPRSPCGPGEFYCVRCRAPRRAAEGMADFMPLTPSRGNLIAICESCDTLMHRQIFRHQLKAFEETLDESIREGPARISECSSPCPDDNLAKEARSDA